jgi:hypothetical protein
MNVHLGMQASFFEPRPNLALHLLNESAHWKAEDKPTRPSLVFADDTVPEPGECDTGGFAKPGGDTYEPVPAHAILGKASLPPVRMVASDVFEKLREAHRKHSLSIRSRVGITIGGL